MIDVYLLLWSRSALEGAGRAVRWLGGRAAWLEYRTRP